MTTVLVVVHWMAGLYVLAEAFNKLERCAPLSCGKTRSECLMTVLLVLAWSAVAIGAAGAVVMPLLPNPPLVLLRDACVLSGLALLLAQKRLKEFKWN